MKTKTKLTFVGTVDYQMGFSPKVCISERAEFETEKQAKDWISLRSEEIRSLDSSSAAVAVLKSTNVHGLYTSYWDFKC